MHAHAKFDNNVVMIVNPTARENNNIHNEDRRSQCSSTVAETGRAFYFQNFQRRPFPIIAASDYVHFSLPSYGGLDGRAFSEEVGQG